MRGTVRRGGATRAGMAGAAMVTCAWLMMRHLAHDLGRPVLHAGAARPALTHTLVASCEQQPGRLRTR